MEKSGVSAIVAMVFLILVSVVGVGFVWISAVSIVEDGLDDFSLDSRLSIVSSKGYTVWDEDIRLVSVQIERKGDGVICGFELIFDLEGNSVKHFEEDVPGINGKKMYYVNLSDYSGELFKISVAPVFCDKGVGEVTDELEFDEIVEGDLEELIDEEEFESPNGGAGNNFVIPGSECVSSCGESECGDDGCGGSCGSCASGYICSVGVCVGEGEPFVCQEGMNCFYVSVSGAGDHNGSVGNEFNLSEAQTYANNNLDTEITFILGSGNYASFEMGDHATATANVVNRSEWVTWRAETSAVVEFDNILIYNNYLKDLYMKFENILVNAKINTSCSVNSAPWTWGDCMVSATVQFDKNNYLQIINSTIKSENKYLAGHSVYLTSSANILFENNTITKGLSGIKTASVLNITILNNHIFNLSRGSGISIDGDVASGTADNTIIENNYVHHTTTYNSSDEYYPPEILFVALGEYPWNDTTTPPVFDENDVIVQGEVTGNFVGVRWEGEYWEVYVYWLGPSKYAENVEATASISGITFTPYYHYERFHVGSVLAIHTPNVIIKNNTLHSHKNGQGIYFYGGDVYYNMLVENNLLYDIGGHTSLTHIVGPAIIRNNTFIGGVVKDDFDNLIGRYSTNTMIVGSGYAEPENTIFSGDLDDMDFGAAGNAIYRNYTLEIQIDSVGVVDTYNWSIDGVTKESHINCSNVNVFLSVGNDIFEKINFENLTGHSLGDKWTTNYSGGYNGSEIFVYNNIIVGSYALPDHNTSELNQYNNLWYSNSGDLVDNNSIVAVWENEGILHGYPEYFENLDNFNYWTPEYPDGSNHNPFFVNPGFYTKEISSPVDSEKNYLDEGSVFDYHPLMSSPVCDGSLIGSTQGTAWAGALSCVACAEGHNLSCGTGLFGVCSAGTRTCNSSGLYESCVQINTSSVEVCSDMVDNDCDGRIDCIDDDCFAEAVCEGRQGLVLELNMNDNVNDWSGLGNDGSWVPATESSYSTGVLNNAAFFQSSSYIDIPGLNDDLKAIDDSNFTISFWVKTSDYTDNPMFRFFSGSENIALEYNSGNLIWFCQSSGCNADAVIDPSDEWRHVVLVYDNSDYKLYLDGAMNKTYSVRTDLSDFSANYEFRIGYYNFNGSLDEVMVYSRALSESEVLGIYNLQKDEGRDNIFAINNNQKGGGEVTQASRLVESQGDLFVRFMGLIEDVFF